MNYITIELKTNNEGGTAADVLYSGKDERVAWQRYHATLSTAATSGRPMHAAVILGSDGSYVAAERFETEQEG